MLTIIHGADFHLDAPFAALPPGQGQGPPGRAAGAAGPAGRAGGGAAGGASAPAAACGRRTRGQCVIFLRGLAVALIDKTAGALRAAGLIADADADQVAPVLRAFCHRHIAVALLRDPAAVAHALAAFRTVVLAACHGFYGGLTGRVAMEDGTADAACGRIAVEAVRMALQGLLVFGNAARQVQTAADDGRVVGITERVVRRARRLDAEQLHGGREGFLSVAAAGLRIEDHLRIVPLRDPVRLAVVQQDIVLQHRDVVKAPRQEDAGAADPVTEALERLGEGRPSSRRRASRSPVSLETRLLSFL